jgi:outer membrane biosynthesis protein TonB
MRRPIFALSLAFVWTSAAVWGQAMTEAAAAAAGGTAGGVAGKKVSEGISTIFGKVDHQTKQAAKAVAPESSKQVKAAPPAAVATVPTNTIQVGPGVPSRDSVPPPPPIKKVAKKQAQPPVPVPAPAAEPEPEPVAVSAAPMEPPAPKPPPRKVTAEDLNLLAKGTSRDELLKLGQFSSRIMMWEDGHLVELYRYSAGDVTLGSVRVSDGAVANVIVRR